MSIAFFVEPTPQVVAVRLFGPESQFDSFNTSAPVFSIVRSVHPGPRKGLPTQNSSRPNLWTVTDLVWSARMGQTAVDGGRLPRRHQNT